MCTSIAKTMGDFYFGRNMDLEYEFGQQVVVTPRNYPFHFRAAGDMLTHHTIIGMARVQAGYPLYAEAANERGLCMAGLNFPQSAHYDVEKANGMDNVSPFEFIAWVLGQCSSVDEALPLLRRTHLTDIPFDAHTPVAPLHWHLADKHRSVVIEPLAESLRIHENPVGVMTNEPTFDFHMTNLRQYMRLSPEQPVNAIPGVDLKPLGWGFGALGMPGDASPASRFVRAVFHTANSESAPGEENSVTQFFHLLDSVAMTRGSVRDGATGKFEITLYASCISADTGMYYYKTYDNNRITAVSMHDGDLDSHDLRIVPLVRGQQIAYIR